MYQTDWVEAIGAELLGARPFAAARRKRRRQGEPTAVMHIQFPFKEWDGPFLEGGPENAGKGRGQVYSLDGAEPRRSCQEVEVAKRLRTIRDNAFWLTDWPQLPKTPWMPWVLRPNDGPDWLQTLDAKIRGQIWSRSGGMPDVVAWSDKDPLSSAIFIECKGPREPIREAQEDWVWAAQQSGVRSSQIAVAVRPEPQRAVRPATRPTMRLPSPPTHPPQTQLKNLSGADLRRAVIANTHVKPEGLKRIEAGVYDLGHGRGLYRITQTGPSAWVTTLEGKRIGTTQPTRYEAYLQVRAIDT